MKKIDKIHLEELYYKRKLSSRQIAKIYHCNKNQILNLMKKYEIKPRNKSETSKMIKHKIKYKISKQRLENLYIKQKKSMEQIANLYNTYSSTIYHKIKSYKLKTRSFEEGTKLSIPRRSINIGIANIKHKKLPFSENKLEKSYLFGFAAGDLYLNKRKYGSTIRMGTCTSKEEQVKLVKNLFSKYTHVNITKSKDKSELTCNLDPSFEFLLDYKKDFIPYWALKNRQNFLSFLGGYIDAEGHFGVSKGIGVFSLSSYDKNIIKAIHKNLKKIKITSTKPRISIEKGYIDKRGVMNHKDLWTIRIKRMIELYRFVNLMEPYIEHQKRYNDLINVKNNLINRNSRIKVQNE